MSALNAAIARRPVLAYVVIAYAFSFTFTALLSVSLVFGFIALFGPALAAILVTLAEGSFPELRSRIFDWRHSWVWYAVALGIPFAVTAVARLILTVSGNAPEGIGSITSVEIVIFVLVIGEEIGWRSFLQPRLRQRLSLALAGLAVGVIWVFWHLPLYLAPEQGLTALAGFAAWVIPLAVVMGVVAEQTRFSAIIATVMHGSANIATPILLPDVDRTVWLLLGGAIYAVVAVILVVAYGRGAARRLSARTQGLAHP
jgi:membrane protease YdiL (CAAX protease family)